MDQAEQLTRGQSVIVQGPFPLLYVVHKGAVPPAGTAQKPTVSKWCAYLKSINEVTPITESNIKYLNYRKIINSTGDTNLCG